MGAENDVDPKGSSLPHNPIQEKRGVLGHPIVLGEELLELVDEQKATRHGLASARAKIPGHVLRPELPEEIPATPQLFVDPLEHAEAKLAIALDRHDAGVGQAMGGVALELDAFLEVDQVEFDLIGIGPHRQVGDDDVEEGRFAGASFPGDEGVLAGAFAEGEVLQLGRTGPADGDTQFVGRGFAPDRFGSGCDLGEGDFHTGGIDAGLACAFQEEAGDLGIRRCFQGEGQTFGLVHDGKSLPRRNEGHGKGPEILFLDSSGAGLPPIPVKQEIDAAPWPGRGDGEELLDSAGGEAMRKIRDDKKAVFLRDVPGLGIVFCDGAELIAQVHLDDFLQVLVEFREPFLDLIGLGPDFARDEGFLVICEPHHAGEGFPKGHGIEKSKGNPAGGRAGEQTIDRVIQGGDGGWTPRAAGFDDEGGLVWDVQEQR